VVSKPAKSLKLQAKRENSAIPARRLENYETTGQEAQNV